MKRPLILAMLPLLLAALACAHSPTAERQGTLHRDQVFEHDGRERRYHFYEATAGEGPAPWSSPCTAAAGSSTDTSA